MDSTIIIAFEMLIETVSANIGSFVKSPTIKGTLIQIWKSSYMFAFIWK